MKKAQKELNQFIKQVQKLQTNPEKPHVLKTKARKPIYVSDKVDGNVDLADATSQVRKQIVKWQNAQSDTRLQQLKEHKEYKIEIKPNINEIDTISGTIKCIMCDKAIHLGIDQNNGIKLSNWIRHVKLCVQHKRSNAKQQVALTNYFSSCNSEGSNLLESSSSSESLSDKATFTDNASEDSIKQGFRLAPPIAKK